MCIRDRTGSADGDLYFSRQYGASDTTWSSTIVANGYLQDSDTTLTKMNFTGQHRCVPTEELDWKSYIGKLVVSTGKYNSYYKDDNGVKKGHTGKAGITINDALPIVELCKVEKDKRVFGVISDAEDSNTTRREWGDGCFISLSSLENDSKRVFINGVGEGAMWVCNRNGNFENGDYIQSSELSGYGEKQDDDLYHNYTCAKITMDCLFELGNDKYECRQDGNDVVAFVGVIYLTG